MIKRFLTDESGATAIEYALIAALISIALFAAIAPIGDAINVIFGKAEAGFTSAP
jgi:pilus assembly protein Flp/PilA